MIYTTSAFFFSFLFTWFLTAIFPLIPPHSAAGQTTPSAWDNGPLTAILILKKHVWLTLTKFCCKKIVQLICSSWIINFAIILTRKSLPYITKTNLLRESYLSLAYLV